MPIVDIAAPDITTPVDTPKGFAVTPGKQDVDNGSDAPDWRSVYGAAFRQDNLVGSYISGEDRNSPVYAEPGFKAWDQIKGTKYETRWSSFIEVRNSRALEDMKAKIDREDENRKLIQSAPWYVSLPAQIAAGVLDLPTLLPGGAFVRGATGGFSVGRTAANTAVAGGLATAAQEGGLQALQETRPLSESAVNVGASVILGGLLGAGGAKLLSKAEWNNSVRALERDLIGYEPAPTAPLPTAGDYWDAFHGTRATFEKFDPKQAKVPARHPEAGVIFFSPTVNLARSFSGGDGGRIIPVRIRKGKTEEVDAAKLWIEDEQFHQELRDLNTTRLNGETGPKDRARLDRNYDEQLDRHREEYSEHLRLQERIPDVGDWRVPSSSGAMAAVILRAKKKGLDAVFIKGLAEGDQIAVINPDVIEKVSRHAPKTLAEIRAAHGDDLKLLREVPDFPSTKSAYEEGFNDYEARSALRRDYRSQEEQASYDRGSQDAMTVSASGGALTSAGAAAVGPATLTQNTIAGKMAGAVAASTAKLNPALRILQSPSAATRDIGTKLFENSIYLKKNMDGVASEPAAETLMKEWNAGLAKSIEATDEAFSDYVKAGGSMNRREFREAVGQAMRRNDESPIPEVAKVASAWRSQVFDPLKQAAIDAKLLPPDVTVETAASYFSRMWNRNRLIAQEGRFKQIVRDWIDTQSPKWAEEFDRETLAGAKKLKDDALKEYQIERRIERDARFGDPRQAGIDVADEVFNKLTGKVERGVRPEFTTVEARGPLKERTFNIPDALVEEFLEHDVTEVGRRYARVMGADVELTNKFGSPDMKEALDKVRADYKKLRSGLEDENQRLKLDAQEKDDLKQLEGVRDWLRSSRNESPVERNYAKLVRSANHVNYIRSLGEVTLSSLTDIVRPAMVHGLMAYMETIGQLATNMRGIKMSVAEAKLAGQALESILAHRLGTITDITDPYSSRGPIEAFLEKMTNVASKWNGIRMWTDMGQSLSSVMTQNRILKSSLDFGGIAKKEKSYLAFLGIDESMAGRIAAQFEKHGDAVNGINVANTEDWTDKVAVRTYRAAMNKDVDSIIVKRGAADIHLFGNTPTGKALLQFKSFALASHQRILLRGLQEDQSRFIGGTLAMTGMGMLVTYLKAISGNRPETQERALNNPGWWVGEGLDRSGVLSVPMEFANVFERATGFNPLKTPLRSMDEQGGISQKMQNRSMIGALAGPSAGLVDDTATAASIPRTLMAGEETTKGQRSAVERLLPFNSYAGMRTILRYLINPD